MGGCAGGCAAGRARRRRAGGRRQCVCRVTRLFGGALAAVHDVAAGASLPARATALQAVMADERLAPGQAWLGLGLGLGL